VAAGQSDRGGGSCGETHGGEITRKKEGGTEDYFHVPQNSRLYNDWLIAHPTRTNEFYLCKVGSPWNVVT
jgi:hypothetical protein